MWQVADIWLYSKGLWDFEIVKVPSMSSSCGIELNVHVKRTYVFKLFIRPVWCVKLYPICLQTVVDSPWTGSLHTLVIRNTGFFLHSFTFWIHELRSAVEYIKNRFSLDFLCFSLNWTFTVGVLVRVGLWPIETVIAKAWSRVKLWLYRVTSCWGFLLRARL
jgi:hypothetical protein